MHGGLAQALVTEEQHPIYSGTSALSYNRNYRLWTPDVPVSPVEHKTRRQAPALVRANRALRLALLVLCGLVITGYGLDVMVSNDVSQLQEQARRLSEQNTELSAQLLRVISFQGIQDSLVGRCGLRVPERVLIVKEIPPYPLVGFESQKHHLPLLAGY